MLRDRDAPLIETRVESFGHRAHVDGKAALRRQARGEKGKRDEAERAGRNADAGRRPGDKRDRREIKAKRDDAAPPGARRSWRRRD